MGVLETVRGLIGRGASPVPSTSDMHVRQMRSEYMRGGRGLTFSGWRPRLRETYVDVASSWEDASARALDVIHNSGWISGAIDQAVADTVGTGLRLNAQPDPIAFGGDEKAAREWARRVERRFNAWAGNGQECDLEGRRTFGQIQAQAFRMWFALGETLIEIPTRTARPGVTSWTKVGVIPPYRLSTRTSVTDRLIQGVQTDADGMPIAYHFRIHDPASFIAEYVRPARDRFGRPKIVHTFDGMPGQVRGITPLIHALRVAKQFDQLADATLMASIIQTVFAATISADQPTNEMLEGLLTPAEQARFAAGGVSSYDAWFEAQAGWYEKTAIDVGVNGRIAHLFPGQKLEFHGAKAPSTAYKDFALHLLRELARCIGVTYESATGDYQGVTFSSIRMATNSIFEIVKQRRKFIVAPTCQAVYEAWLEEDIDRGFTPYPGGIDAFVANRAAVCRADWRGSPKPQPDDLKTSKAHETWKRIGVMSDGMIAADLGVDIDDVYADRAREAEMRKALDLTDAIADPQPDPAAPPDPEDA